MNKPELQNNRYAAVTNQASPIKITHTAVQYVRKKLQAREPGVGLRMGLKKAGCSGWYYEFDYATQKNDNELLFWIETDIYVLIDKRDLKVFEGAIIDCVKTGLNLSLTCINPNEGVRCGCGESFTLAE